MHSHDTKDQFVQLRAAGQSFGQISEQLGVAKSTLHHWEDEREADIARLRRLQWEETEKQFGRRLEDDLERLALRIIDWEQLMDRVNVNRNHSLRDILFVLRETRREYFRLRALLMGTSRAGARTSQARPPKPMPTETAVPSTSQPFNPSTLTHAEPNKTERFTQNGDTAPLITNDLQQPAAESFDSCVAIDTASPASTSEISNLESEIVPIQPSAPQSLCGEHESQESNKTERFTQNSDTAPLITKDLQQPAAESFDFQPSDPPPSSDATAQRCNDLTPPAAAADAGHESPQHAGAALAPNQVVLGSVAIDTPLHAGILPPPFSGTAPEGLLPRVSGY